MARLEHEPGGIGIRRRPAGELRAQLAHRDRRAVDERRRRGGGGEQVGLRPPVGGGLRGRAQVHAGAFGLARGEQRMAEPGLDRLVGRGVLERAVEVLRRGERVAVGEQRGGGLAQQARRARQRAHRRIRDVRGDARDARTAVVQRPRGRRVQRGARARAELREHRLAHDRL